MLLRNIFIFLLISKSFFCEAQKNYYLQYAFVDSNKVYNLNLDTIFSNRIMCNNYVATITNNLKLKGYITASIDSIQYANDTAKIKLFVGYKYVWENIDISKNDLNVLTQCGWNNNMQKKENFQAEKIFLIQQKMLDYYQNNGYPFAQIQLDNIVINNEKISASLSTDKGTLYLVLLLFLIAFCKNI
jgi:outer membrane protein assembly factor BamA